MAFERIKKINGHEYKYLVENVRVGGTVRQNIIQYMGRVDKPLLENRIKEKISLLKKECEKIREPIKEGVASGEMARIEKMARITHDIAVLEWMTGKRDKNRLTSWEAHNLK